MKTAHVYLSSGYIDSIYPCWVGLQDQYGNMRKYYLAYEHEKYVQANGAGKYLVSYDAETMHNTPSTIDSITIVT